jgi:hypothetical protein
MVNLHVGSMSRSGLTGSWLKVMRGCVNGLDQGVERMGDVVGIGPLFSAVRNVGPEGGRLGGDSELVARNPLDFM